MDYADLHDRGLLRLSGGDVIPFLQGLITNDAGKLAEGRPLYAALLSPQGKFLHDFFLVPAEGAIWLDTEKPRLDELIRRLSLYKLRSKVTIERAPENMAVMAAWGEGPLTYPLSSGDVHLFEDPRLQVLGWRVVGDKALAVRWCDDREGWNMAHGDDYDAMRLSLGVPEGGRDLVPEKSFLAEWGFEGLHGVDFKKGCYVGQELTARAKYRGQVRKYVHHVRAPEGNLPAPGTEIRAGDKVAGELHSCRADMGIALLRLEHIPADQEKTPLMAGDKRLIVHVPEWARPFLNP